MQNSCGDQTLAAPFRETALDSRGVSRFSRPLAAPQCRALPITWVHTHRVAVPRRCWADLLGGINDANPGAKRQHAGRDDVNPIPSPNLPSSRYCLSGNRSIRVSDKGDIVQIHGSGAGIVPLLPSGGPEIRLARAHFDRVEVGRSRQCNISRNRPNACSRRHSKKNAPKGVHPVALVDLRGIEPPDLFHAKEARSRRPGPAPMNHPVTWIPLSVRGERACHRPST